MKIGLTISWLAKRGQEDKTVWCTDYIDKDQNLLYTKETEHIDDNFIASNFYEKYNVRVKEGDFKCHFENDTDSDAFLEKTDYISGD